MTRIGIASAWSALLFLGLVALGCSKKATEPTGGTAPTQGPGGPGGLVGPGGPGGPGGGPGPQDVLSKLPGGDEFAAGKKVYADNNCARCHKLGDTGGGPPNVGGPPGMSGPPKGSMAGPPGAKAPDLTAVGAAPEHTAAWLTEHIRDPKTHKPQSSMPASGPDKISDADLANLVKYLASRK